MIDSIPSEPVVVELNDADLDAVAGGMQQILEGTVRGIFAPFQAAGQAFRK